MSRGLGRGRHPAQASDKPGREPRPLAPWTEVPFSSAGLDAGAATTFWIRRLTWCFKSLSSQMQVGKEGWLDGHQVVTDFLGEISKIPVKRSNLLQIFKKLKLRPINTNFFRLKITEILLLTKGTRGTSPSVQWLGLWASTAGGVVRKSTILACPTVWPKKNPKPQRHQN